MLAALGSAQGQPEPYDLLDQIGGSWVNLATFPVRPMVFDPQGDLWAVNHHDSTVEHFVGLASTPDKVYGVPWSPVAIGWWDGNGTPELLVVCRGTWAVAGLDPSNGKPTRLLQLRPDQTVPGGLDARIGRMAEPGDILVDQVHDRAFVSCTGADSVVQIDLAANQIVRAFHDDVVINGIDTDDLMIKSPLFLSWHPDGDVLCAPLHSGNNSLAGAGGLHSTTMVDDGNTYDGVLPSGLRGLPDQDLFRIHPYVDAANPGSVEPILRTMGTILFAHGVHPITGDFWQLNTEAINKDPARQTEPSVKGIFADNRVSIVDNNGSTWGTTASQIVSLDPNPPSGPIFDTNTIGQPFALAFDSAGYAFITGLLTDNVAVLDQNGGFVMEWDLPDGSIPRGVLPHPTLAGVVFVHLWGLNEVRSYTVSPASLTAVERSVHRLRYDPTPTNVKAGRKFFYDAAPSKEKNLSCATCHIEGGNDFLVWNLSNGPLEQKGPMFTQTLVGLERLAPFHWRGERQLVDFKPAFVALLGASAEPSTAQFADLQAFLFSLRNPANPNQNRQRLLDPLVHHPDMPTFAHDDPPSNSGIVGNGVTGEADFLSSQSVIIARHACIDCHDFPTGTNNDINVEGDENRPRRVSMKPAPFHELWRKHQKRVLVQKDGVVTHPSFLGSGFAHAGKQHDLFRFLTLVIADDNDVKANNVADFIQQWDQGLGQAVHFAYLLNSANANSATTTTELDTYLHGEMLKGNCDIAVIGRSKTLSPPGQLSLRRWAWDSSIALYVCEDPAFPNRTLAAFKTGASTNNESNVFVGVPRGMAERFAIDYDMDGIRNIAELPGREYTVGGGETVPPGYATGGTPQILWESTGVARLVFTTNEPTRATITYDEPRTIEHTVESPLLSRYHSVLLTGLRPSTSSLDSGNLNPAVETPYSSEVVRYTITIKLKDARNNPFDDPTSYLFATDPFIVPVDLENGILLEGTGLTGAEPRNQRSHVVQSICMSDDVSACDSVRLEAGKWRADVDFTIAYKRGKWLANGAGGFEPVRVKNRVVFGRVLIERAADGRVETAEAAGLDVTAIGNTAVVVGNVMVDKSPTSPGAAGDNSLEGVLDPTPVYVAGLVPTDPAGHTRISFYVDPNSSNVPPTPLLDDDRIIFNVEGVLELTTNPTDQQIDLSVSNTIIYGTRWRAAFMQWSFPETKEARASVKSAPL